MWFADSDDVGYRKFSSSDYALLLLLPVSRAPFCRLIIRRTKARYRDLRRVFDDQVQVEPTRSRGQRQGRQI